MPLNSGHSGPPLLSVVEDVEKSGWQEKQPRRAREPRSSYGSILRMSLTLALLPTRTDETSQNPVPGCCHFGNQCFLRDCMHVNILGSSFGVAPKQANPHGPMVRNAIRSAG